MEGRGMVVVYIFLVLCFSGDGIISPVQCGYHSRGGHRKPVKEKITQFHFFVHDTLDGANPSAVEIARPNATGGGDKSNPTPFGHLYAFNDILTEGPEATSKVIGNAQGAYLSSGRDTPTLMMYADFGFTTGKFNGSSFSVFSRNPITENIRELAVVGGRGKLRLARGFAEGPKPILLSNRQSQVGMPATEYFVPFFDT
ncbi:dirigent protein 4-like [Malania oleifera]|uniref:dirigent protein 4-like n=1 Tax=Malania oleifera TaxID=397392 RepID=UPI0025ADA63D|nr:dirigent protein 4-like [Malania oleifera]